MKFVRFFLVICIIGVSIRLEAAAASEPEPKTKSQGCSEKSENGACTRSDKAKSRKKRTVTLPNQTSLVLQTRIIVPQAPVGLYIIWMRARFFIRPMFTQTLVVDPNDVVAAGFGRSFSNPSVTDDISNVLKRTIVDDQIDVLGKIEQSLDKGGMAGRQCVLRAICELTETPIHHWTVFGEMLNNLLRPKNGTHEALEEYKKAEKIGEEQGDCWSFYPECPISIFNVIPDVYTTDDQVEVSFDGFDSGSKFDASNDTSEGPYSDPNENSIDDDIMNIVKNGGIDGLKVKEHNIDIDFTT
jgi:hypothetical protein